MIPQHVLQWGLFFPEIFITCSSFVGVLLIYCLSFQSFLLESLNTSWGVLKCLPLTPLWWNGYLGFTRENKNGENSSWLPHGKRSLCLLGLGCSSLSSCYNLLAYGQCGLAPGEVWWGEHGSVALLLLKWRNHYWQNTHLSKNTGGKRRRKSPGRTLSHPSV